jgi:glycosyltransferase involved in cell wall biosynthesis
MAMRTATVRDEDSLPLTSSAPTAREARGLDALYLLNCLTIGGSERKIVRLVNRLWQRGVRAGIAYLNGPETLAPFLNDEIPRWHLDRKGRFSLSAARRLTHIIDANRVRTLFTVNMYPTLYATAAATMLGTRAPQLIGLVNTTDFGAGQRWRQTLYKRVLDRFDRVVYGCRSQRKIWIDESEPAWARSTVVYNGVDLNEFNAAATTADRVHALRTRLGCTASSFVIGSVGRLVPAKNHAVLIDSVAKLRAQNIDARLLIVGEGELHDSLRAQAATLGLADVVLFTGALTDLRPALAAMDVFVLPSLFVETFSNAALEAMAMSKAVVMSDVGGAAEMVRDGVDGRVLPRDTLSQTLPDALANLAKDRVKTAALGASARHRVEEMFSFDAMVDHYEQLIGRPHGDGRA